MVTSVFWSTTTMPTGTVVMTLNCMRLPMSAMFGTTISLSLRTGLFIRPFLNISSTPSLKLIFFPAGMPMGDMMIFSAGKVSAFLTRTLSSTVTPALDLVIPSMRMSPLPSSSMAPFMTLATAERLPTISTTSPICTLSLLKDAESILTLPNPASDFINAVATFSSIRSPMSPCKRYVYFIGRNPR